MGGGGRGGPADPRLDGAPIFKLNPNPAVSGRKSQSGLVSRAGPSDWDQQPPTSTPHPEPPPLISQPDRSDRHLDSAVERRPDYIWRTEGLHDNNIPSAASGDEGQRCPTEGQTGRIPPGPVAAVGQPYRAENAAVNLKLNTAPNNPTHSCFGFFLGTITLLIFNTLMFPVEILHLHPLCLILNYSCSAAYCKYQG